MQTLSDAWALKMSAPPRAVGPPGRVQTSDGEEPTGLNYGSPAARKR